ARARYLMGTVCEATAALPAGAPAASRQAALSALDASLEEIARLESILSDWKEQSELSRLNREATAAPFACSEELYDFVSAGGRFSRLPGGAFDLTVAPLVVLYDLRGRGRWAPEPEVEAAVRTVGYEKLHLDDAGRRIAFTVPGMALDPGGLGKGYALD